ncbi:hypothetical protein CGRA01v4_00129 [Colletotrichum graminicola]|nr:hypothetical protein CGRA01v4_00129 [Colletotrichum graminicola]
MGAVFWGYTLVGSKKLRRDMSIIRGHYAM